MPSGENVGKKSSVKFKPHEENLRKFFFDEKEHDCLLGLLGIDGYHIDIDSFKTNNIRPATPEGYCNRMTKNDLIGISGRKLKPSKISVQGVWDTDDDEKRISIKEPDDYGIQLSKALNDRMTTDDDDTIPITIFIPIKPCISMGGLSGFKPKWDFYDLDKDRTANNPKTSLIESCDFSYALRMFIFFKSLGIVNTTKTKSDEQSIYPKIMSLATQLNIFNTIILADIKSSIKKHIQLSKEHGDIAYDVLPNNPKLIASFNSGESTDKSFSYSLPENETTDGFTCRNSPSSYLYPSLDFSCEREAPIKYRHISVHKHCEDNNTLRHSRSRDYLMQIMTMYCSLTNGTAITFRVPKSTAAGNDRLKTPTLLLPEICAQEVERFKGMATNTSKVPKAKTTHDAVYGLSQELRGELKRSFEFCDGESIKGSGKKKTTVIK